MVLDAAPNISLREAAMLDVINQLCGSQSEAIGKARVTGTDGLKYTWIDFEMLSNELPILKSGSKSTVTRIVKSLERQGLISTMTPDNRRKFARLTEAGDSVFRAVDIPRKLLQNRNRAVAEMKQFQGGSCCRNETYHNTNTNTLITNRKNPVNNSIRRKSNMKSIKDLMKDGMRRKNL